MADDALSLTVIGSSPAWALGPGRPSSSYLVEVDGKALLLDLGQGSLGALHAYREPSTLLAVAISHLHPDHHVDLVALRHLLRYGHAQERHVELLAPGGLRERYDAFLGEAGFLDGLPGEDLAAGTRHIGPFAIQAAPVHHALNSHAFRVTRERLPTGAGLVYSGDCGRPTDLLALAHPGDTLLCEAFWGLGPRPDSGGEHLTVRDAAHLAHESRVARLVLTHIDPSQDLSAVLAAAEAMSGCPVALATPGLRVEIA